MITALHCLFFDIANSEKIDSADLLSIFVQREFGQNLLYLFIIRFRTTLFLTKRIATIYYPFSDNANSDKTLRAASPFVFVFGQREFGQRELGQWELGQREFGQNGLHRFAICFRTTRIRTKLYAPLRHLFSDNANSDKTLRAASLSVFGLREFGERELGQREFGQNFTLRFIIWAAFQGPGIPARSLRYLKLL
jgi:hypothetical protein